MRPIRLLLLSFFAATALSAQGRMVQIQFPDSNYVILHEGVTILNARAITADQWVHNEYVRLEACTGVTGEPFTGLQFANTQALIDYDVETEHYEELWGVTFWDYGGRTTVFLALNEDTDVALAQALWSHELLHVVKPDAGEDAVDNDPCILPWPEGSR